jgi:hypothetical protein
MGLINKKSGYLLWAICAFLLAPFGFGGGLAFKGSLNHMNPISAGVFCLAIGCVLLYFYFTAD